MTTTTARQELQDALERVVWRFRDMTAQDIKVLSQQLAGSTRTRRSNPLLDTLARGRVLAHLLEAELPDATPSAAVGNGYEERTPWRPRLPNSQAGDRSLALQTAHAALKVLFLLLPEPLNCPSASGSIRGVSLWATSSARCPDSGPSLVAARRQLVVRRQHAV
ncbi:hypothetical protein [Streptomyces mirabilis]|uniref:hypothetical protein n=1 Tax=Streptomyces mirabilis TaxID=68239 RepID=UPI0036B2DCEF